MSLPIVHYNDPILRKKGARITAFDADLAKLGADMVKTMHASAGIGLAAQQVGHALQLFVMDLSQVEVDFTWEFNGAKPPLELFMPLIVVNPVISIADDADEYLVEEGCLSFPKIRGDVQRPEALTMKFQDERGTPHTLTCDGLLGRCILHEFDHLQGILFIERMGKKVRASIDADVKALAKKTKDLRELLKPTTP